MIIIIFPPFLFSERVCVGESKFFSVHELRLTYLKITKDYVSLHN